MVFLYTVPYKMETKEQDKIVRISAYRVTQTLYIKGLHDAVRTYSRKILPRSLVSCLYCTVYM